MQILVNDPSLQTILFGIVLVGIFLSTFVIKKKYTPFSFTTEVKGFAILTILFAHIGYTLSLNNEFLFPFSVFAGVGVNLFLFLSGYGLTCSQLKKNSSVLAFYKQRLLKLFIPFWIALGTFVALDALFLHTTYTVSFLAQSSLGIFNKATMLTDFNSPLWYFTLILFYYLAFPILFSKKRPWVTAILLYLGVWTLIQQNPFFFDGVIGLYEVHMAAFPLGILIAWYASLKQQWLSKLISSYKEHQHVTYPILALSLISAISYLAIYSNVGDIAYKEEWTSILTMFLVLLLFVIKKRESKLLSNFGLYSYEIYLLHWPLLLRYDVLYKNVSPWLATLLYLGLFILLAMVLQKVSVLITKSNSKTKPRIV